MSHPIVEARTAWIHRCAQRLARMRPEIPPAQAYMLADDLWSAAASIPPDQAAVQFARSGVAA